MKLNFGEKAEIDEIRRLLGNHDVHRWYTVTQDTLKAIETMPEEIVQDGFSPAEWMEITEVIEKIRQAKEEYSAEMRERNDRLQRELDALWAEKMAAVGECRLYDCYNVQLRDLALNQSLQVESLTGEERKQMQDALISLERRTRLAKYKQEVDSIAA